MILYFALIALPIIGSVEFGGRGRRGAWLATWLVYVVFVGFREHVGMDWNNYLAIHAKVSQMDFATAVCRPEPLSYALFWVSTTCGSEFLLTNCVASVIFCAGLFSLAATTARPWIAVIAATPYLVVAVGLSAVRQSMAIGVIFLLVAHHRRIGFVGRVLMCLTAGAFHSSALAALALVCAGARVSPVLRVAIPATALALTYHYSSLSESLNEVVAGYQATYLGEGGVLSPGAIVHMGMMWLPAIVYLTMRNRLRVDPEQESFLLMSSLSALGLVGLYFVNSTAGSRMALYFYFLPMYVYPMCIRGAGREYRSGWTGFICTGHVAVMWVWLEFANNSHAFRPYRCYLLNDI